MKLTKENLSASIDEMNAVMKFAKPINVKNLSVEVMQAMIENFHAMTTYSNFIPVTAGDLLFSETAKEVFAELQLKEPRPATKEEKAKHKELNPKAETKERYTRAHALKEALIKGGSEDEIVKLSDELWKTNNSHRKQLTEELTVSRALFKSTVAVMMLFGFVTESEDGKFSLTENLETEETLA